MRSIIMLPLFVLLLSVVVTLTARPTPAAEEGFVPLFDGKTLAGWKQACGTAEYRVEQGSIVGQIRPGGPNSFLRTEKTYGDFVLKLEAKFDVPGNSGIQFRSHQRADGRVFGYQFEFDPSPRAWSGGIYDEGRRGWLYRLEGHEKARGALKLDQWNEFVIRAVGPMINTWVNGVECADLVDMADMEGFIALQVHTGKQGIIRWRNIRLKDLGTSKWRPLDNGKDFDGWRMIGSGQWTIENGVIRGTKVKTDKEHGHLITDRQYTDFAVRLKYKAVQGNSGLYFRVEEVEGPVGVKGFQAEIDPDHDAGGLYETFGRAWVAKPKPEQVKTWYKPGAWNEMSVVAVGRRIVVHVNGKKSAELKDDPGRTNGYIALQLHGGQDMDILFKHIQIMEIPSVRNP